MNALRVASMFYGILVIDWAPAFGGADHGAEH